MHRSASWSRFSEDYYNHVATSPSKATMGQRSTSSFDVNDLPVYDPPISELTKKEKARVKFAENAVHVIPFVLFLCALILWFFSNPDVGIKGDPMKARIEGLTLEGEFDTDSDGTQTGILPLVNSEDVSTKELEAEKITKKVLLSL